MQQTWQQYQHLRVFQVLEYNSRKSRGAKYKLTDISGRWDKWVLNAQAFVYQISSGSKTENPLTLHDTPTQFNES
jgi:hypothetical protein